VNQIRIDTSSSRVNQQRRDGYSGLLALLLGAILLVQVVQMGLSIANEIRIQQVSKVVKQWMKPADRNGLEIDENPY